MQRDFDTTTQLDLVRDAAAARQRRAATYRHDRPGRPSARRVVSSGLTAVLLTLGAAGGAAATVTDSGAHCAGYEIGMPDGCWGVARVLDAVLEQSLVPASVR